MSAVGIVGGHGGSSWTRARESGVTVGGHPLALNLDPHCGDPEQERQKRLRPEAPVVGHEAASEFSASYRDEMQRSNRTAG